MVQVFDIYLFSWPSPKPARPENRVSSEFLGFRYGDTAISYRGPKAKCSALSGERRVLDGLDEPLRKPCT
jgi:hypothetical protein